MSTFDKVAKWNERCGNVAIPAGTEQYYQVLQNQLARIAEEVNEAQTAIQDGNILEVIDAGLDMDVVVAGFNLLAGGDYHAGIKLVLENNDLKYTKSKRKAQNWEKFHIDNGTEVYLQETVQGSQTFYCVRRTKDGKILKPGGFPQVDLTGVCPQLATVVGLLLDDSEVGPNDEQREFMARTGIQAIYLDKFEDGDGTGEVMTAISNEAEGNGAFIFLQNNHIVGAEKFDIAGPGANQDEATAAPTKES